MTKGYIITAGVSFGNYFPLKVKLRNTRMPKVFGGHYWSFTSTVSDCTVFKYKLPAFLALWFIRLSHRGQNARYRVEWYQFPVISKCRRRIYLLK